MQTSAWRPRRLATVMPRGRASLSSSRCHCLLNYQPNRVPMLSATNPIESLMIDSKVLEFPDEQLLERTISINAKSRSIL